VHRSLKPCSQSKNIHLTDSDPKTAEKNKPTETHAYIKERVDVGLECCCGVSLQMTVKYIFSSLKLLHHREFQYRLQGLKAMLFMYFHSNTETYIHRHTNTHNLQSEHTVSKSG